MARKKQADSLSVVQRLAVCSSQWSKEVSLYPEGGDPDEISGVPMTGLRTEEEAEALAARLEAEARRATPIGPFLGGLLPEKVATVVAAAQKAGLPALDVSALGDPVEPTPVIRGGQVVGHSYGDKYFAYSEKVRKAVSAWWHERAAEVTPEQSAAVWDELFAEPCFYGVRRVPIGE